MTVSQQWKVKQMLFLDLCMYVWSFLPGPLFLGQDHCTILETQIEMLHRQIQLYDLSESKGGNVDQSEDHGEEVEDDDVAGDAKGKASEEGDGDDDAAAKDEDSIEDDDEQCRTQEVLILDIHLLIYIHSCFFL